MAGATEQRARRVARRVFLAVAARELARLGAALAFALGALVLVLRGAFDVPRPAAAWALLPLALVPALAAWRAARRRPAAATAAAWLDLRAGGTGLILTDLELTAAGRPDAAWRARAAELAARPALPPVRLGAPAGRLLSGIAFAAAALWIALPARASGTTPADLFTATLERLAGRFDALQELADLDPALVAELGERLARMREKVEEAEPEGLFEAVDRFEERLGAEAESLADLAQRAEQGLALAERLAELDPEAARAGLEEVLAKLGESGLARAAADRLGAELRGLRELEGLEGLEALAGRSLELPEGLPLSPEQLEGLSRGLREALEGRGADLLRSGLLDPDALLRLREARRLGESLLRRAGLEAALGAPGAGGVDEGPGSARLTWGEESAERAELFEAAPLSPARFLDAEHTAPLDERETTPLAAPEGEAAGLVLVEEHAGEAAWRRRLAPRHRAAVRAFFAPDARAPAPGARAPAAEEPR